MRGGVAKRADIFLQCEEVTSNALRFCCGGLPKPPRSTYRKPRGG